MEHRGHRRARDDPRRIVRCPHQGRRGIALATEVGRVKGRVPHLLIDYFRRTFGVWLLLALLQLMQTVAFWASKIERAPALGVVLASLVYFAAFESPYTVLRILPLTRADIAKFRWW